MTTSTYKQKVKRPSAYSDLKNYIIMQIEIKEGQCWRWPGSLGRKGYCYAEIEGRRVGVHRLSYEIFVGPIPEGKHVLHRCDHVWCVNPGHLFVGTHTDNMRDASVKGRLRSKFTLEKVVAIKELFQMGGHSINGLARELGVAQRTIQALVRGETWAGVGPDIREIGEGIRTRNPAKLTAEKVVEIRGLLEAGVPLTEIGERFGVSRRSIYAIREGETWRE